MKYDKTKNTVRYTRKETAVLTGRSDMKRDDLNRELRPQVQAWADKSGNVIDVYFSDGTMDGQVYPSD